VGIHIGGRYRLMKHPNQPVGIAVSARSSDKTIMVEWENAIWMPQKDHYPESAFSDGTFEFLNYSSEKYSGWNGYMGDYGHEADCSHEWQTYNGISRSFEFCKKCDIKKE
jgi:hypothetical protein